MDGVRSEPEEKVIDLRKTKRKPMRAGNTIQEARSRYMDNASELQLHAPNMQLVEANIAHLGRVLDQGLALLWRYY